MIVLLPCGVVLSLLIWNFTQPATIAYEINPTTLELRTVEFVERPMTGATAKVVRSQDQMAIGKWLIAHDYLQADGPGDWVLVKSYNPRDGFTKGEGRALQSAFNVAAGLTPMPHPSVDSPNDEWVEWCTKHPARARYLWQRYAELSKEPNQLWRVGEMLRFTLKFSAPICSKDDEFKMLLDQNISERVSRVT